VSDIKSYYPDAELFQQEIKGYQPYVKVTSRVGSGHELSGFFQRDRTHGQSNCQPSGKRRTKSLYFFDPINLYSNGGNVYSGKLTSAWAPQLPRPPFSAGYNDKRGNDEDTYEAFGFEATGPNIEVYEGTSIAGGLITGNKPHPRGRQRRLPDERAGLALADSR